MNKQNECGMAQLKVAEQSLASSRAAEWMCGVQGECRNNKVDKCGLKNLKLSGQSVEKVEMYECGIAQLSNLKENRELCQVLEKVEISRSIVMETVENAWTNYNSPTKTRHSAPRLKYGQIKQKCNPTQLGTPQGKIRICREIIDQVLREVSRRSNIYQSRMCHTQAQNRMCHTQAKVEGQGNNDQGDRKRILCEKEATQPSIQPRKRRRKEPTKNKAELGTKIKIWLGVTKGPEEVNTKSAGYHQIKTKNISEPKKKNSKNSYKH